MVKIILYFIILQIGNCHWIDQSLLQNKHLMTINKGIQPRFQIVFISNVVKSWDL